MKPFLNWLGIILAAVFLILLWLSAAVLVLVLYPFWLLACGVWFCFLPRDLRASVVKAFDFRGVK